MVDFPLMNMATALDQSLSVTAMENYASDIMTGTFMVESY
jgi:hypothetical protein